MSFEATKLRALATQQQMSKTLHRTSLALVLTLDSMGVLEAKGNDSDKR